MPADIARVSPLGNRIVSGGVDGRVIVWDATSCTVLHTINAQDWVVNLAFIAGGDALVTLSLDGVVHAWDLESGRRLLTLPDRAFDLAAFHDGLRVATLRLQEVTTWNISTGKAKRANGGRQSISVTSATEERHAQFPAQLSVLHAHKSGSQPLSASCGLAS